MTAPATISHLSLEYVYARIDAEAAGMQVDPTPNTVTVAFMANGAAPTPGDFKAGSWDTDATDPLNPVYYARCLVGPGGAIVLAAGSYKVWVKITDTPELPVLETPNRLVVT